MTDGLGPCPTPWCEPEHEKYTWQGPDDLFCVICDGCQVEGPHCEDEGDAQAAWNTRASLAAQDGGLISDKSRIERLRRLVHRWITQGQVRGVVHDMDLQCEIDDAFAWANGNGISAPAPSLAAQDGLVEALRACVSYIQSPLKMSSDLLEDRRRSAIIEKALAAIKGDKS